jgi:hypothetical protein
MLNQAEIAKAMPSLRWLVTDFSLLWLRSGYMGFLVDKMVLEQVFSEHFGCPLPTTVCTFAA